MRKSKKYTRRSETIVKRFLEKIAEGDSQSAAAKYSGASLSAIKTWRDKDPDFAQRWADADVDGFAVWQEAVKERAVTGTLRPVFHKGKVCGAIREYSDALLMFGLRAKAPEIYCDKTRAARIEAEAAASSDKVNASSLAELSAALAAIGHAKAAQRSDDEE